jgi:hypothetical protein
MSDKNLQDCQKDYLETSFYHSQRLIELADSKASIILGVLIFLIPVNFGVGVFSNSRAISSTIIGIIYVFFVLTTIFFGLSFYYAMMVIKPRLTYTPPNNIFFGEICKKTQDQYQEIVLKMDSKAIMNDYINENYALAQINKEKYKQFKRSMNFLILGFVFLVIGYVIAGCLSIVDIWSPSG